MKRESFKSRLGFLLVSAGCAIGIGNVWRFPYVAGQNGGGFFRIIISDFPGKHGTSGINYGACGRTRESQKCGYGLQDA